MIKMDHLWTKGTIHIHGVPIRTGSISAGLFSIFCFLSQNKMNSVVSIIRVLINEQRGQIHEWLKLSIWRAIHFLLYMDYWWRSSSQHIFDSCLGILFHTITYSSLYIIHPYMIWVQPRKLQLNDFPKLFSWAWHSVLIKLPTKPTLSKSENREGHNRVKVNSDLSLQKIQDLSQMAPCSLFSALLLTGAHRGNGHNYCTIWSRVPFEMYPAPSFLDNFS